MPREKGIVSAAPQEGDLLFEASLRPRQLADFTGQPKLKENLAIAIEADAHIASLAHHHFGQPGRGGQ